MGLKINKQEAANLLGKKIHGIQDAAQAAQVLRNKGVGTVNLTLGKKGAVLATDEGTWHGYGPTLPTISSVGSGDAFLGGWLNEIVAGHDQFQSLKAALAAGAANTQKLGACRSDYEDFLSYLERTKVDRIPLR
jgi:fructose-1-phosphate kinase PfkB-like protein